MDSLRPIFIVGTNRSGTTITRRILGNLIGPGATQFEPRMFSSFEPFSGVIIAAFKGKFEGSEYTRTRNRIYKQWAAGDVKGRGYSAQFKRKEFIALLDDYLGRLRDVTGPDSQAEIDQIIREFAFFVFGEYARRAGGRTDIFIDDTPSNIIAMTELARIFPDAKFIHSVRDGRLVADSIVSRQWTLSCWHLALQQWHERFNIGVRTSKALPEGMYREFDFTRAKDDVEGYFRSLCDFAELDFDPAAVKGFDTSRSGRAANDRPKEQNDYFRLFAEEHMERYGWE